MLTKENCTHALSNLYDLVDIESRDKEYILKNGQILEDSYAILQELVDKYFVSRSYNKFEDLLDAFLKDRFPNFVVYDRNNYAPLEIFSIDSQDKTFKCIVGGFEGLHNFKFEENRYYPIQIPKIGD